MDGEAADGWRDALAILAGALAGDHEAVGTVILNCDPLAVVGALAAMTLGALRDAGTDPAQWVAAEQARALQDLAAG
jgi:hypothetical protein